MTGWLIFYAYAAGWLITARTFAMREIDKAAKSEADHRAELRKLRTPKPVYDDGKPLVDMEIRVLNLVVGFCLGLGWPLVLLVWSVARTLKSPTEKAEEQRLELEKLRALAKKHGLPLGDEK